MKDLRSAPLPGLRDDDHVRGPEGAPLVLFYGDFECPRCALAWTRVADAPLRLVFRHFALKTKHPRAPVLAQAAEAAARQGAFWDFATAIYADQGRSDDPHLWAWCERAGLDVARFEEDRRSQAAADRVGRDVQDALRAGVTATPTLFGPDERPCPGPPDPALVREWAAIG